MDQDVTRNNLEKPLKKAALAFYKWSDDEETSGNEHHNHCILFTLFIVFNYELSSQNSAAINIRISAAI